MSKASVSQLAAGGRFEAHVATAEELDRHAAKRGDGGVLAPRDSVQFVERDLEVRVEHPGGGTARLSVCARRLWSGGIAVLYPGYVHANSECSIVLPRVEMSTATVEGIIRACRHVSGTIHDISIEFARSLELKRFLRDPALLASLPGDQRNAAPLRGSIMYIGPNRAEQMLINYHLQKTDASLSCYSEPGPALDLLRQDEVRCIICEFDAPQFDGTKLIGDLMDLGSGAPIVAVTSDPSRGQAARRAGADMVVNKPYERATLIGTLTSVMDSDARGEGGPIQSTLAHDAEAKAALEAYIEYAGQISAQIRDAIKRNDFDGVRENVLTLRGTGETFGFEALSECGTEALAMLDQSGSIQDSRRALQALLSAVRRLEPGQGAA